MTRLIECVSLGDRNRAHERVILHLHGIAFCEDHWFSFQIVRFNALAKPTQIKYGVSIHAAAALTAENSRMVQAIDSQSVTLTNRPAPIFPAPKNSGAQTALSRS